MPSPKKQFLLVIPLSDFDPPSRGGDYFLGPPGNPHRKRLLRTRESEPDIATQKLGDAEG